MAEEQAPAKNKKEKSVESIEKKAILSVQIGDVVNAQRALAWLGEQKFSIETILAYMATKRVCNTIISDYQEISNSIIKRNSNGGTSIPPNSPGVIEINELLKQPREVPNPGIKWEMVKDLAWPNTNAMESLLWLIPDIPL